MEDRRWTGDIEGGKVGARARATEGEDGAGERPRPARGSGSRPGRGPENVCFWGSMTRQMGMAVVVVVAGRDRGPRRRRARVEGRGRPPARRGAAARAPRQRRRRRRRRRGGPGGGRFRRTDARRLAPRGSCTAPSRPIFDRRLGERPPSPRAAAARRGRRRRRGAAAWRVGAREVPAGASTVWLSRRAEAKRRPRLDRARRSSRSATRIAGFPPAASFAALPSARRAAHGRRRSTVGGASSSTMASPSASRSKASTSVAPRRGGCGRRSAWSRPSSVPRFWRQLGRAAEVVVVLAPLLFLQGQLVARAVGSAIPRRLGPLLAGFLGGESGRGRGPAPDGARGAALEDARHLCTAATELLIEPQPLYCATRLAVTAFYPRGCA